MLNQNITSIVNSKQELTPKNLTNEINNTLVTKSETDLFYNTNVNASPHLQAFVKTIENRESQHILSQNSPLNLPNIQKNRSLSYLIDESALNKALSSNLWDINLRKTLSDLQSRLYENSLIKFRVGGRAIYSASQIVRAKSSQTIEETNQTRDDMFIKECDADDLCSGEIIEENSTEMKNELEEVTNSVVDELAKVNKDSNKDKIVQVVDVFSDLQANCDFASTDCCSESHYDLNDADIQPDAIASLFPTPILYNEDKHGERYIKAPLREVVKHSRFEDLTKALIKTLNYQLIKPIKSKKNIVDFIENPISILPENILKKAEDDRALVEEQISKMYEKITYLASEQKKVSFFDLIISADIDGIVRTLLYVLHLVNRKKIELWQDYEKEENNSIFIKLI